MQWQCHGHRQAHGVAACAVARGGSVDQPCAAARQPTCGRLIPSGTNTRRDRQLRDPQLDREPATQQDAPPPIVRPDELTRSGLPFRARAKGRGCQTTEISFQEHRGEPVEMLCLCCITGGTLDQGSGGTLQHRSVAPADLLHDTECILCGVLQSQSSLSL